MNLCIDIGNTSTKAALFSNGQELEYYKPFRSDHLLELRRRYKELRVLCSKTGADPEIEKLLHRDELLTHKTPLPISINYDTPETLGRDRIATAVGAYMLEQHANWLIIDLGTCLTIDLLEEGVFSGGLISPGVQMRFKAMDEFTAGLPLVSQNYETTFPGKSTITSMQVGVCQSITYEIKGYVRQLNTQFSELKIVDCSSQKILFDKELKNEIFARPKLVVEGLNHILDYNAEK